MIVEEHLEHKYVAIWVANFEKYDKQVQQTIRKIIDENHQRKIKTVVYSSGTKSLQEQTANQSNSKLTLTEKQSQRLCLTR